MARSTFIIVTEADDIARSMGEILLPETKERKQVDYASVPRTVLEFYTNPARTVLSAERNTTRGFIVLKGPSEEERAQKERYERLLGAIFGTKDTDDPELKQVLEEASNVTQLSKHVSWYKDFGPLRTVDLYTEYEIDRLRKRDRNITLTDAYIEAVKRGRDRFHQVYFAAQEISA